MKYSGRFTLVVFKKSGHKYNLNFSKWEDIISVMKRLRKSKDKAIKFKILF